MMKIESQFLARCNFSDSDNYVINYIMSRRDVLLAVLNFSEL